MEGNIESPTFSSVVHLQRPHFLPDVADDPDDVLKAHFNDPNYDFATASSTEPWSAEADAKTKWRGGSVAYSGIPDVDTESQLSATSRLPESKLLQARVPAAECVHVNLSPYPEVRAAVSNTDDPEMLVNTFRVWFLGILFALIVPCYNTVIVLRMPFVLINTLVVQLITLPLGKLMEKVLPHWKITVFGRSMSLNPGPFTIKEHTLISIMANVVVGGTPVTDIAATESFFYGNSWPVGKQFLLGLSCQILGFAYAGIVRQFLVWPSSMIWPGILVRTAMLNTMHRTYGTKETRHMSRLKFLYLASACSFIWYWVPGYLWTGLSVFNWVCWIAPNNIVVNSLFGTLNGLGMGLFTFDWSMISILDSPLVVPWWAQVNMFATFVVVIWFLSPILWAKNVWYSQFLPLSAPLGFDNTGLPYDPSAVVTDGRFDQAKYARYSPMYLPMTFAITYGTCFATYTAVIVHTFLWYRHDIKRQFRRTLADERDIHSRLMMAYPEVPHYWFAGLGVVAFILGIISIQVCKTGLPVWAFILSLLIAFVFVVPSGIVMAITNQQMPISVLSEIIFGYMLPGRPLATMVFKSFATNTASQAQVYVSDLKMGHYMKIPPRVMFTGQVITSIIAVISSIVGQHWAFNHIEDICTPTQKDRFICPMLNTYATASVIWGGIGPQRLFSRGALYYPLIFSFPIGAILPVPLYYLARRYPRSHWRYVHVPVALLGVDMVPPANGMNFSSWFIVGTVFQWFMRRYHFRWWMRYTYLLSTGLDVGVILGLIAFFVVLQVPKSGIALSWWGNNVWLKTADALGTPLNMLAPGETFGPTQWS
ncbi:OPT oligopeptide transporter [Auriscalpium vulgare]|uniref:OPT oligopeptide transporter n=1 Tax=Auriscalpium vulgare TaxID=40419 RepID=A0ACB8RAT1_9AGAM|nr:OPT oligopeptide transporter [Auriscalpium vulgare]